MKEYKIKFLQYPKLKKLIDYCKTFEERKDAEREADQLRACGHTDVNIIEYEKTAKN